MSLNNIHYHKGDLLEAYPNWPAPTCIISDGPYGIGGFPGDPISPDRLPDAYRDHIIAWSKAALPSTTLWFWCTEIGWALTHPLLAQHGWIYRGCNTWDKGVGHIAGNCNGKTMRKFPVVTEVCVQYTRDADFDGLGMKDWLRSEWQRTGLPFSKTNDACGVKNAATRKYFTKDHLFYPPPPEVFLPLARYANREGDPAGTPYFEVQPHMTDDEIEAWWASLFPKFNFEYGTTNVWTTPAIRGSERLKQDGKAVHLNQKPETLFSRLIEGSTDIGDVVWDPFCGTGTGAVTASRLGRVCCTAESNPEFQDLLERRLA